MPGIDGSKEALPLPPDGEPVTAHPLRAMARAGIKEAIVILRPEKTDIPSSLGSGASWGIGVGYLETGPTRGPAETLDKAYHRVRGVTVALGFPDLLMTCPDPYGVLLAELGAGQGAGHGSDAVLGVFPASTVQPADPVRFDGTPPTLSSRHPEDPATDRQPRSILAIEPKRTGTLPKGRPAWCWGLAVWSPRMTEFLHEEVARGHAPDWGGDWGLGAVFNRALKAGLRLTGVAVSSDPFLDIGTPEGLALALAGRRTPGR